MFRARAAAFRGDGLLGYVGEFSFAFDTMNARPAVDGE
jgi:hypothetical protein